VVLQCTATAAAAPASTTASTEVILRPHDLQVIGEKKSRTFSWSLWTLCTKVSLNLVEDFKIQKLIKKYYDELFDHNTVAKKVGPKLPLTLTKKRSVDQLKIYYAGVGQLVDET